MDRAMVLRTIKEMRWLHFNFPFQDNSKNDADKMCNAIHLYTGDAIAVLEKIAPEPETDAEGVTSKEEIKACPFCGQEAKIIHFPKTAMYAVGCADDILCPGYVYKCAPVYFGKDNALEAWNTRK